MNKQHGCAAALAFLCLFFANHDARAQATDAPKVEVGVQFTSLTLADSFNRTEPGFGGRVTYNLTDNVGLEAQFDFFPDNEPFRGFRSGGRIAQGLFGVKAGKRFEKFGLFGKVRPGFTSFSAGRQEFIVLNAPPPDPIFGPAIRRETHRETHFATDIGAVLEFYPTRRIVTRFDAGDTIIRYGDTTGTLFTSTGTQPFPIPGEVRHNFQFSAGIGFRF
ncbi:MAG TPA: outer membrane beta-barrel protein [Pyrinomonadaceae bacterium]|nr:outer membrane beta-barrel protein [Pyrinomonadaceae bacterium]